MPKQIVIAATVSLAIVGGLVFLLLQPSRDRSGEVAGVDSKKPTTGKNPNPRKRIPKLPKGGGANASDPKEPKKPKFSDADPPLLSGAVLDSEGKPIHKAHVWVLNSVAAKPDLGTKVRRKIEKLKGASSSPEAAAAEEDPEEAEIVDGRKVLEKDETNKNGKYKIFFAPEPPKGEYRVRVRAAGFLAVEKLWVNTGEPSKLDFKLEGGGESIEGTVAAADGSPVKGAQVEAFLEKARLKKGEKYLKPPGKEAADHTKSDEAGHFRLVVPSGLFRLNAKGKGHGPGSASGIESGARDVKIRLSPVRNIAGKVFDEKGALSPGAKVELFKGEAGNKGPAKHAVSYLKTPVKSLETGADGAFAFEELTVPAFILKVTKPGYEEVRHHGNFPREGEPKPVEIRLKLGGAISGIITDPSGKPVVGALVGMKPEKDLVPKKDPSAKKGLAKAGKKASAAGAGGSSGGEAPSLAGGDGKKGKAKAGKTPKVKGEKSLGPDGLPLPASKKGAALAAARAVNLKNCVYLSSPSDAEGKYRIENVRRATYSTVVEADGFRTKTLPGVEVKGEATKNFTLDPGLALDGKIVDKETGEALPGAVLKALTGEGDPIVTRAGAGGEYSLRGLGEGPLRELEVRAPGHSILFLEGLMVSSSAPHQDFPLERSASLSGLVVNGEDEPVPFATVTISSAAAYPKLPAPAEGQKALAKGQLKRAKKDLRQAVAFERAETHQVAHSGMDGAFHFEDVTACPAMKIDISHPAYIDFHSEPFVVAPGEKKDAGKFPLQAGARLTVLVLRPDGSPAAGEAVDVRGAPLPAAPDPEKPGKQGASDRASRTTGSDGKALFTGLREGPHSVAVKAKGYRVFRQAGIPIARGQPAERTVQLIPESVIQGSVTDGDGTVIPRAHIRAVLSSTAAPPADGSPPKGNGAQHAATRSDGTFRMGGLADGPYQVQVTARGFVGQVLDAVPVDQPLDVRLQRRGDIEGTVVVAETGAAVDNFTIFLQRRIKKGDPPPTPLVGSDEGARAAAGNKKFVNSGGVFRIREVDPGEYVVRASAKELSPIQLIARVDEGRTASLAFPLSSGLSVTGLVIDRQASGPVLGAEVVVFTKREAPRKLQKNTEDGVPRVPPPKDRKTTSPGSAAPAAPAAGESPHPIGEKVTTDEKGTFGVRNIPEGKFVLVVDHPDYVIAQKVFTIHAGGKIPHVIVNLSSGESLSGKVVDSGGNAVAGAEVEAILQVEGANFKKRTTTDALGRYTLRGLLPGPYVVIAALGDLNGSVSLVVKRGVNRAPDIKFPLAAR